MEDIKILEDYIELIKKGYCEDCNELCNIYSTPTYPAKKISEATEHLIKAYKELEEKYNYEKNRAITELDTVYIKARYDERDKWKSLVEETIEEYKQRIEKYNEYKKQEKETDVEFYENITNTAIVQVLQKLLEKRK